MIFSSFFLTVLLFDIAYGENVHSKLLSDCSSCGSEVSVSCANDSPTGDTCSSWNKHVDCLKANCNNPNPQPKPEFSKCLLKCGGNQASLNFLLVVAAILSVIYQR
ncbi:hypothetical protein DdX_12996 [Ditylenchus destructor]|uniref:Uncharacterized protein n=1 Tax=Ditylenchus destructor TaxID=166010 RepID=A0AAD4MWX0_9BILA|nr:hypothetical protein DdX_12996 [Ditylenchus destructor]